MRRTPLFTALLWTATAAGGCGDPAAPIVDASIIDGPVFDAAVDGPSVTLTYAERVAMAAECGGAVTSGSLTVRNDGGQAATITALDATAGFTVNEKLPLAIAAGAEVTISITPPAAVIGTDRGGTEVTGTLTITTAEAGALAATVTLASAIHGANLDLVDGAGNPMTTLTMGGTSACPSPGLVGVRNTGDAPATIGVSVTSSSPFTFGSFASDVVAPGETITHQIGVFALGQCTATDNVEYTASGTVCTTTPVVLSATFSIVGTSSCFCS